MIDAKELLKKHERERKVHSIDPFQVFENMETAALAAMDEYARQEAIEFMAWFGRTRPFGNSEELYEKYLESKTREKEK